MPGTRSRRRRVRWVLAARHGAGPARSASKPHHQRPEAVMQPSPRSPLVVVTAVVGTLVLVVTGWLLGHGGGTTPAIAATGASGSSGDRARDGVLASGTGEVTGRPDPLVTQFGAEA